MSEATKDWQQYVLTAGALIEALRTVPPDTPVVMSKDAEGNGYSPLSSAEVTGYVYEPDSTWSGEVHDTTDPDYEPDDQDVPVVLLGPVN